MKHLHYAAAAALLFAAGCKSFDARLKDLRDCARVSVGVGTGVSAEVRAGAFTWPAIGTTTKTHRVGFENRHIAGYWYSEETPFPIVDIAAKSIPLLSPVPIGQGAPPRDKGGIDAGRAASRQALDRLRGRGANAVAMDRAREASSRARAARARARASANDLRTRNPEAPQLTGGARHTEQKLKMPEQLAGWTLSYKRHDEAVEGAGQGIKRVTHMIKRGYWHPWHTPLKEEELKAFNSALDLEVGATLGVVSVRGGVNVFEILDFVFGIFWCDIAQDDGD